MTDHVFSCLFVKIETPEILSQNIENVQNIHSPDLQKKISCLIMFEKVWRKREEVIDKFILCRPESSDHEELAEDDD